MKQFPLGQHGTFHLHNTGWCKLTLDFSICNFMVLEVRAEGVKKSSEDAEKCLYLVICHHPQISCK